MKGSLANTVIQSALVGAEAPWVSFFLLTYVVEIEHLTDSSDLPTALGAMRRAADSIGIGSCILIR